MPACFAGRHQVAEQRIEVQRVFAERLVEAGTGLHVHPDVVHQARHRRISMAPADDVERLHQRHTRLQHRGQLPGEKRQVLVRDLASARERLLLDLADHDAAPAQRRRHDRLAARPHLALDHAPVLVATLPVEDRLTYLDAWFGFRNCSGGHRDRAPALLHSLVHPSTSSTDVIPAFTLISPDWRRSRTPLAAASRATSGAVALRRIMSCICSVIGITW